MMVSKDSSTHHLDLLVQLNLLLLYLIAAMIDVASMTLVHPHSTLRNPSPYVNRIIENGGPSCTADWAPHIGQQLAASWPSIHFL